MINSEDKFKLDDAYKYESKLQKNIWNQAIDKAIGELQSSYPEHAWLNAVCATIRGLKK